MLRFQVDEIGSAGLTNGEDVRLEEELEILSNLSKLKELVETAYELLYSAEGSSVERLSGTINRIQEMASIDPEAAEPLELLEQAQPLIEDAAISVRELRDRYDLDPGKLDDLQERLRVIGNFKKKYGDSIEEVLAFHARAAEELEAIEGADESTEGLEAELEAKTGELEKRAQTLSRKRQKAARTLETDIMAILKGLALERAVLVVSFGQAELGANGVDDVEFLFSANKGETPKPLAKVISGGELSRIMLAIKTVLREVDKIPVLIFDEVDAGIGGKTAMNVARRLKESASGRQVLCITHLPQIASHADTHFLIDKSTSGERAKVTITELAKGRREEEIARMLSGKVTDKSLEHAREIMAQGK